MAEQPRDEEAIFLAALERATPQERHAFVEETCAGDQELLQRVKELLASHDDSMGPLDSPPVGVDATSTPAATSTRSACCSTSFSRAKRPSTASGSARPRSTSS